MTIKLFDRYKTYIAFLKTYILVSFLVRFVLYILSFNNISFSILHIIKMFALGFVFDLGVALFFSTFYLLYLFIIPPKIIGSVFDKIATHFILFITALIAVFAFLAEFPFWDEFNTRFNFIAVDYLIYTFEVFENIQQSYPLPLLITGILLVVCLFLFVLHKRKIFKQTFGDKLPFLKRLTFTLPVILLTLVYCFFIKNKQAEWSANLYENELSKNGVYSFFAAYRSNELDYDIFYPKLPENEAMSIIKKELLQQNQQYDFSKDPFSIERTVVDSSTPIYPNVVLICMESMSGNFMKRFGNKLNITPTLDSLANDNIAFNNMYATGTRTVRGMEALTLCVPPTPGNSIVRRLNNDDIFSIANIFQQKNYTNYFIYGGDGYFDNMNTFFGGQGFKIVDRNRGNPLSDNIKT